MSFFLWRFTDTTIQYISFFFIYVPFYNSLGAFLDMQFIAQPGIGHQMTPLMVKEASDWFERFLKQ